MVPGGEIGNADGGNDVPERRGWVCFVLLRKKMTISLICIESHIYRGPVRDFTSG